MGGSRVLQRWLAFFARSPFGGERDDVRASVVALTVARGSLVRKDKRDHEIEDFGLVPRKGKRAGGGWKTWQQAKAAVVAAMTGKA